MSLTSTIKSRFENLILGSYAPNASFSISTGRFKLHDRDLGTIEQNYDSTSERRFQVHFDSIATTVPENHLDGFVLYEADCVVKVGYYYTQSGDDLPEGSTDQSGTGYLDAIKDRAMTDYHDIQRTLTWYENYGGLTPSVYAVILQRFTLTQEDRKIIAAIQFKVMFQASLITSYI